MLELHNVCKRFGDRGILPDINLSIQKGEIVSILGPSGCGKTTLLSLTDITAGMSCAFKCSGLQVTPATPSSDSLPNILLSHDISSHRH